MKIFIAGATGAIGQPLIAELLRQGHTVTGMTQSETGANKITALGAQAEIANAFDAAAVEFAMRRSEAEAVIDELTSLPKDPADMPSYAAGDAKLRLEGGANLHRAAEACGVKRYIQQSSGFFLVAPTGSLADESAPMALHASPSVAASSRIYTELERRIHDSPIPGVALRYGFFYGPNTWYHPDGGAAAQVRKQQQPVIGAGNAICSFIHIDDAATATVAALTCEPGVYNIVDDNPSPVRVWLPAFANAMGAPPPPHITEDQARQLAGEDAIYYGTRLCGATNQKARHTLNIHPRPLEWLT